MLEFIYTTPPHNIKLHQLGTVEIQTIREANGWELPSFNGVGNLLAIYPRYASTYRSVIYCTEHGSVLKLTIKSYCAIQVEALAARVRLYKPK